MAQRESVIVFSGQGTFLKSMLGAGAIGDRFRRLRDAIGGTESIATVNERLPILPPNMHTGSKASLLVVGTIGIVLASAGQAWAQG